MTEDKSTRPPHAFLVSLLLSSHPGPSVAVTTISVLLSVGVGMELWRLATLGVVVLLGQFSVGLSNDWLDMQRDIASGRTDKPLARGDLTVDAVRTAAIITGVLAVAMTAVLGTGALNAHTVFIAAGWSYNLWLKRTTLSVLPYLIGFGVLPLLVTLALAQPAVAAWWAIGAGSLLGIAAHFANALPDLEADRKTGVIGLPHRVGAHASGIITFAVLAIAFCLAVFGPGVVLGFFQIGAVILASLIVTAGVVLVMTRPPSRLLFQLVIAAALLVVGMLLVAGTHLSS